MNEQIKNLLAAQSALESITAKLAESEKALKFYERQIVRRKEEVAEAQAAFNKATQALTQAPGTGIQKKA